MRQALCQGIQHCLMILVFDSFCYTPSINCFAYYQKRSVTCCSGNLFFSLECESDAFNVGRFFFPPGCASVRSFWIYSFSKIQVSKIVITRKYEKMLYLIFYQRINVTWEFESALFLIYLSIKTSVG